MNSIHEIFLAVKGGAKLEDLIPPGASLPDWEGLLNRYNPDKKKAKKPAKKTSRRTSKRSNYAAMQSAIGWATVELVSRKNSISFDGDADGSPDEITGRDYYGI